MKMDISKKWCEESAKIEGDSSVEAGTPPAPAGLHEDMAALVEKDHLVSIILDDALVRSVRCEALNKLLVIYKAAHLASLDAALKKCEEEKKELRKQEYHWKCRSAIDFILRSSAEDENRKLFTAAEVNALIDEQVTKAALTAGRERT